MSKKQIQEETNGSQRKESGVGSGCSDERGGGGLLEQPKVKVGVWREYYIHDSWAEESSTGGQDSIQRAANSFLAPSSAASAGEADVRPIHPSMPCRAIAWGAW